MVHLNEPVYLNEQQTKVFKRLFTKLTFRYISFAQDGNGLVTVEVPPFRLFIDNDGKVATEAIVNESDPTLG